MPNRALATLFLAATFYLTTFVGCREGTAPPPPDPPRVTVAYPLKQDVRDYLLFTGTTKAADSVEIRARVQGFLEEVHFKEGRFVEKGQPLFTIEQQVYQNRVEAAEKRLAQAEAADALAKANLARSEKLVGRGAVTQEEYETRVAEAKVAQANVKADEVAVDQANIDLNYTVIEAPFDGLIGDVFVDPNNLVGAGENTLLTTLKYLKEIHIYFDVPEKIVLMVIDALAAERVESPDDLKERFEVKIARGDDPDFSLTGYIDFVDNQVDPDTGTALMRAVYDNYNEETKQYGPLFPGLFVRLKVPTERIPDAVVVHEKAIGTDLGGKFMLVVRDIQENGKTIKNDVVRRYVELGPLLGEMRVIRSGLTHDDRYIVTGLQKARPGMPVTPVPYEDDNASIKTEDSAEATDQ